MTRTIEQILGLPPMNQFDLVASPMSPLFIDVPPADNFKPWSHVPNLIPLDMGVTSSAAALKNESPAVKALRVGWMKKKAEVFAGKYTRRHVSSTGTRAVASKFLAACLLARSDLYNLGLRLLLSSQAILSTVRECL